MVVNLFCGGGTSSQDTPIPLVCESDRRLCWAFTSFPALFFRSKLRSLHSSSSFVLENATAFKNLAAKKKRSIKNEKFSRNCDTSGFSRTVPGGVPRFAFRSSPVALLLLLTLDSFLRSGFSSVCWPGSNPTNNSHGAQRIRNVSGPDF